MKYFCFKFLFILREIYNYLNLSAKAIRRAKDARRCRRYRNRKRGIVNTSNQQPNIDVHGGKPLGKNVNVIFVLIFKI